MLVLSAREAREWSIAQRLELDNRGLPARPAHGSYCVRCALLKQISQLTWFCRFIETTLQPRARCLLWVTATGVWPSSENWHLYYRLKEGYGDRQLIDDAPAHLFLEHEQQDLVSFLQLGVTFGWDMHLLPTKGFARAFVSHDEFAEFSVDGSVGLDKIKAEIRKGGFDLLTGTP